MLLAKAATAGSRRSSAPGQAKRESEEGGDGIMRITPDWASDLPLFPEIERLTSQSLGGSPAVSAPLLHPPSSSWEAGRSAVFAESGGI